MLGLSKHLPFEILESNHDYSDIVERLSIQGIFQNALDSQTALLMNILGKFEIFIVDTYAVPHTVADILV